MHLTYWVSRSVGIDQETNWIISILVCGQCAQKIPNGTFQEGFSTSQTWYSLV